ncbi:ATP-dependent Lon protease [Ignavibacterium album JCM 16511]|uniref:ATP-dependent Lon protease n=1 Tax=Ignavibacterium album (strain DSM 19864 / JCM 16511 / NBRC 101810 / Mat9-16) TaxID=945713 RepID=I0AK39_IGNAJ|nr:LON peptidase substrate-binding domain-containing protein [Ignavibacterium album]AFH49346.1 ATP-dependent Lon protease [Ignavibacterium album JCM 16511]
MSKIIPLFPLQLVIFPGSQYPLHIFEPRYKTLVTESLERDTGFGIVAKFENKISDVCTYVKIVKVLKKYPNGESDIVVEGFHRYLIDGVTVHPIGYLVAEVEPHNDIPENDNNDLVIQMMILFERLLKRINYELPEEFWTNLSESKNKSFKIAEKAGLTLEQQQELLIKQSENERLKFLIEHLEFLEKKYSDEMTLKKLIMSDGYLNEKKG